MIWIGRLWICDDVDRLHVKIDKLNEPLVRFCFIRSIDRFQDRDRDFISYVTINQNCGSSRLVIFQSIIKQVARPKGPDLIPYQSITRAPLTYPLLRYFQLVWVPPYSLVAPTWYIPLPPSTSGEIPNTFGLGSTNGPRTTLFRCHLRWVGGVGLCCFRWEVSMPQSYPWERCWELRYTKQNFSST
jgi:hypothetical protein